MRIFGAAGAGLLTTMAGLIKREIFAYAGADATRYSEPLLEGNTPMSKRPFALLVLAAFGALPLLAAGSPGPTQKSNPQVEFQTTLGTFIVQLDSTRAPATVNNFLQYVRSGFYDGTIFHRVVPGFVIQGGGYTIGYHKKPTHSPIPDEANNGLSNVRGTIAMARESAPDTATSQFYINLANNAQLDYGGPGRPGYAVFGHVISGMAVVDKIARTPTGAVGPFASSAPLKEVIIEKVYLKHP